MGKMSWNGFTTKHANALCFGRLLSPRAPMKFDKQGKLLPTPYALLSAELASIIQGEWTSAKFGRECTYKIADKADLARVGAIFKLGPAKLPKAGSGCGVFHALNFLNRDYSPLARQHGFVI